MPRATLLTTPAQATSWLKRAGLALRYQGKGVPLQSLRTSCGPESSRAALARSVTLTNHLLGTKEAVEVSVLAGGRLVLVHRSLVPAVYRLVRRGRPVHDVSGLSLDARQALAFIREKREASAGEVRRHLGQPVRPRHDPGYLAVAELQRAMLVDRGPFKVPKTGIAYLPPEGYPYHLFHVAHPDLVRAASRLTIERAADTVIRAYFTGMPSATRRGVRALFRHVLSSDEMIGALDRLVAPATQVRFRAFL